MDPLPKPAERLGKLPLQRPFEPHVDVAPAGRNRQAAGLSLFDGRDAALIDDVHAAEIRHAVVNRQQLAVVAAVEDVERAKMPKRFPESVKGVHAARRPLPSRERMLLACWNCPPRRK